MKNYIPDQQQLEALREDKVFIIRAWAEVSKDRPRMETVMNQSMENTEQPIAVPIDHVDRNPVIRTGKHKSIKHVIFCNKKLQKSTAQAVFGACFYPCA